MGVASIDDVLDYVGSKAFRRILAECKREHEALNTEIQGLLDRYRDEGKDPNPIARSMSWIETKAKLAVRESDGTIASLMTDGCNMGVKSLSRYLNQYAAADEYSKDAAKKLIALEEKLSKDMRPFL